jgi:NADP-dependent 3-hydroxy acid dehydrogenase YdfG
MNDMNGKVVIVTGASSGIGQATATHLAGLGAKVVLGARRADRLQSLAAKIGSSAIWKAGDVSVLTDQQALASLALENFGRIDALVNNTGLMPVSPRKVRVCVIYPGLTESELVESVTNAKIREYARALHVNAIPAQAIAEAVAYALTQPDSVAVNEITVRPLANQEI